MNFKVFFWEEGGIGVITLQDSGNSDLFELSYVACLMSALKNKLCYSKLFDFILACVCTPAARRQTL